MDGIALTGRWRRHLPTGSFRVQLALLFGAVVIALAAAMSLVLGRMVSDNIRSEAATALQVVSGNAARVLADGLQQRLALVHGLARSESLWETGLDGPKVGTVLTLQQTMLSHVAWMGATDTEGRVRAATGGLLVGADVSSRPWFSTGRVAPSLGDVHAAKLLAKLLPAARDGEPQRFVDFSAPIVVGGRMLGVLAMHGGWDWAHGVVESLLPPNAAELGLQVFIFSSTGQVLYAPDNRESAFNAAGQPLPAVGSTHAGEVVRWRDGIDCLTAVAPVRTGAAANELGWQVVARIPAAVAQAKVERATAQIRSVGIAAAVIAALAAWLIAGSLSGPLEAIAKAAGDVEQGQPGAHIPMYGGNRELARLSRALSGMTRRLMASNEALERRVSERTAALEHANAELARVACHDPLTEVLNRRGFDEQRKLASASACRRGAPLGVIALDADHFKRVNDVHGHAAGDAVLKTLARLMKERLRESDIVGRTGGEEFVALLPDTTLDGALHVARELVRRIAAVPLPGVGTVTVSCGVAVQDVATEATADAALQRADNALYRAKAGGRNRALAEAHAERQAEAG